MAKQDTTQPKDGLCTFQELPKPYQLAFQQGLVHELSGKFFPVEVDWFTQIFMLPFALIYALPPVLIPIALLNQLLFEPASYIRFFQIIRQQNAVETLLMLGLFSLLGALLIYCAWFAWHGCLSFVRTWQAHRFQKQGKYGFGMVLLEEGLVARLINNIDASHHCFWLPRETITNVIWHRIREEGARHSRWVNRTQIAYLKEHQGKQRKYWLTLKAYMFKTGYLSWDEKGDRRLFEQLYRWWQGAENSKFLDDSTDI
ncbi:hypothetical protein [[Limnothrix rosea] IAM M-220]|uniref:hypothetical protein n=1 Tax=[Limnothrix rosea] IAM M-220 TaxID=454133 RepID=UPI000963EB6F|nr:hypothetical protein [[Limnothrix rosea] IAM M-220]OKH16864.1 hypothetical protein NIES208_11750 [[Limnothrix rosea] IAM M-220]